MARDLLANRQPIAANPNMAVKQPRDLLANRLRPINEPMQTPGHVGAPMQESKGWGGVGGDLMGYLSRSLNPGQSEGRNQLLQNIKQNKLGINVNPAFEEAAGFGQQVKNVVPELSRMEAPRIAKNFAKGSEELLNIPSQIASYLGKKDIIPPVIGESIHIPEHQFGLGEKQPGDVIAQQLPGLAASMYRTPLSRVNKKLSNTMKDIEKTTAEHAEILGEGKEHGFHASQHFLDEIEGKYNPVTDKRTGGLRQKIGSQYDKLAEDMKTKDVTMKVTPDMKPILKEIKKLGKGVPEQAKNAYLKALTNASSKSEISGADALKAYREIKHQKNNALKEAYGSGTGISPDVREKWIKKANEFKKLEENMKVELDKQIGTDYIKRLKAIDKEFATKIAPLYENPMYQEMLKHGQTSKNIMKFLHGSTPGNKTLTSIVEKNPILQETIVGQKFAEKPANLIKPNELIERYASMNPRISKIIEEQHKLKNLAAQKSELEQAIMDIKKKKFGRKKIAQGVGATALGTAGYAGLESALGRDWKEDLSPLTALLHAKTAFKK